MDDNKPDIDLPEELKRKKSNQTDNEVGKDEVLDETTDIESQEPPTLANAADYVRGDVVRQDKVEKDRIVAGRYIGV